MAKIPIERLDSNNWAPPWTRREHEARYEFASKFVDAKVVVDCACGDGTSSTIFGRTARSVNGFDISSEAVATAAERDHPPSVVFQCAVATALPMNDRSADVFVSLETIEHIDTDEAFLDEVVRVLKDDGAFVCSTPDRDVHSPGNTSTDKPWTPFHVREYDAAEFARMLEKRFNSVTFYGQNPESVGMTKVKCWIGHSVSRNLVLRLAQAAKLTWFIGLKPARHDVVPVRPDRKYEYLVAVCSDVIRAIP
jgi:ubiquinone/menaquinone biosynthesis C-methylase UbiE